MESREIELVEFHDGTLKSITVEPTQVVISFSQCFVYEKVGPDTYDIQAGGAELRLQEVTQMSIVGALDSEARVSDCEIGGEGVSWRDCMAQAGSAPGSVELTMTNDMVISIGFGRAHIELVQPFTFFEKWLGPL